MANTSDGNNGDPPDPPNPPNAYMNTDALPSDSPSVYRANTDSNLTEIDQLMITDSPAHPFNQDQHHSDDDMVDFYDTDNDNSLTDPSATLAPDVKLYGNADDTADSDADMNDDIAANNNTADNNTDDNNPDSHKDANPNKDTTNVHTEDPNPGHYPRLSYSTDSEWDTSPGSTVCNTTN